jgi:hypothetical protein
MVKHQESIYRFINKYHQQQTAYRIQQQAVVGAALASINRVRTNDMGLEG